MCMVVIEAFQALFLNGLLYQIPRELGGAGLDRNCCWKSHTLDWNGGGAGSLPLCNMLICRSSFHHLRFSCCSVTCVKSHRNSYWVSEITDNRVIDSIYGEIMYTVAKIAYIVTIFRARFMVEDSYTLISKQSVL